MSDRAAAAEIAALWDFVDATLAAPTQDAATG
jgi:hypothetical protein